MANLKSYASQILSEDDKTLFNEAVISASKGAPRGAYILIWLSCAESLKRKFKEAAIRDGQANRVVGKIETAEAAHKSVDMLILGEAKTYGFIDDATYQKLEHVYDLRCLYGHPYESAPSDIELVGAAEVVVQGVLSKPALLKHGFVQSLINQMYSDINYLENNKEKVQEFATDISDRIDPTVYSYFLEKYSEKLERAYTDPSLLTVVHRGLWFLGAMLSKVGTDFYTASQWHDYLARFPYTGQYILSSTHDIFSHIGIRAKDYIISFLLNEAPTTPSFYRKLEKIYDSGLLNAAQSQRFEAVTVKNASIANLKITSCYKSVIEAFQSHNWYQQNPAAQFVKSKNHQSLNELDASQQQLLGRNILQSCEGGSGNALELLDAFVEDHAELPVGIIRGIVFECFLNEDNQFRLKKIHIDKVLTLLKANLQLLPDLIIAIDVAEPKGFISNTDYDVVHAPVALAAELITLRDALNRNRERLVIRNEASE